MSTTVQVGGFELTSNNESSESMVEALTPSKPEDSQPRVTVQDGKPIEPEPEKEALAKAAAELGKEGGKAAAAKRAEAKEKPTEKPGESQEQKAGEKLPAEAKAESGTETGEPLGKRARERVEEATRDAAAARRELAAERRERERLAGEVAQFKATTEGKRPEAKRQPNGEDLEPKAEDFEDYAAYTEARARWGVRQELATHQQAAAVQARAAEIVTTVDGRLRKYGERMRTVAKADPTFAEEVREFADTLEPSFMVGEGQRLTTGHLIADEIIDSEHCAVLLRHFSRNPDDYQRIAALKTPREISREMAKLEARLDGATAGNPSSSEQPAPKPASRAHPPLQPVKGTPPTAEPDIHGDLDFDTFVTRRKAQRSHASR